MCTRFLSLLNIEKEKMILFYRFGAPNEKDFEYVLRQMDISYIVFAQKMEDYHADAEFSQEFLAVIHGNKIDKVFSYDYFPLISMLCEMNHIEYISWIFDCPLTTLQSKTIGNECNRIYCFDRLYTRKLVALGAKHCSHFPLGVRVDKARGSQTEIEKYRCDCSFLGSLYNEEKNRVRHTSFCDYTNGFVEGLLKAQAEIYGYNFIYEAINETVVKEISEKCHLELSDYYIVDQRQMVANALNKEMASREREIVLQVVSDVCDIDLYTGSNLFESLQGKDSIHLCGYADYDDKMPFVFQASKINLNITSRSIESGISLRVLDILSVGGFCITNYQPEIDEYFVDGEEIVMYTSLSDLIEKVNFYLNHEEERKRIAENGYNKVRREFNLETKVREMIEGK